MPKPGETSQLPAATGDRKGDPGPFCTGSERALEILLQELTPAQQKAYAQRYASALCKEQEAKVEVEALRALRERRML